MLFIHEGFPWFSHKSSCEAFCLLVNARLWSLTCWWLVWVRHVCFAAPLICVGWSLLCSCAQASPSAILCLCKAGACQCLSFGLSGYPVPANPDPSRPFNEERLLLARLQVSQSALMLSGLLMLSMATPALPRTEGTDKVHGRVSWHRRVAIAFIAFDVQVLSTPQGQTKAIVKAQTVWIFEFLFFLPNSNF